MNNPSILKTGHFPSRYRPSPGAPPFAVDLSPRLARSAFVLWHRAEVFGTAAIPSGYRGTYTVLADSPACVLIGAGAGEPRASPGQRDPAQGQRVFCPGGARPPMEAMISFVDAYRDDYGVEPICKVIEIAPSTYHAHIARRARPETAPARVKRDTLLSVEIRRVYEENFQVYGVRKVWRQLLREGYDVARCTVARLMKKMALQGVIRGRRLRTTVSDKAAPCPLDHVNRRFRAPRPNMLWVSDFTYVATWTGFVYVAFVIDAYARRIVGWRVSRSAHAGFVLDALEQALHERKPVSGALVHHSDRGVQYVSIKYTQRLAEAGLVPSVGSVGDSYDNALAVGGFRLCGIDDAPVLAPRNTPPFEPAFREFSLVRSGNVAASAGGSLTKLL